MLKLNKAIFVQTNQDEVITPISSAIFGELQWDGEVYPLEETEIWKKDLIGLRTLSEEGKLYLMKKDGHHVEMSQKWFDANILPLWT